MTADDPNQQNEASDDSPEEEKEGDMNLSESGDPTPNGGRANNDSAEEPYPSQPSGIDNPRTSQPSGINNPRSMSGRMVGLPINEDDWLQAYASLIEPIDNDEYNEACLRALEEYIPDRSDPEEWTNQSQTDGVISQQEFAELVAQRPDQPDNVDKHYKKLSEGEPSPIDVLKRAGALDRSDDIISDSSQGTAPDPISLIPTGINAICTILDATRLGFTPDELSENQQNFLKYLGSAVATKYDCDPLKARIYETIEQYADTTLPDITTRYLGSVDKEWVDAPWRTEFQFTDRLSAAWEDKYDTYVIFVEVATSRLDIHNRDGLDDAIEQKILYDLIQRGVFDLDDLSVLAEADVNWAATKGAAVQSDDETTEEPSSDTEEKTTARSSLSNPDKGIIVDVRRPAATRIFIEGLCRDPE